MRFWFCDALPRLTMIAYGSVMLSLPRAFAVRAAACAAIGWRGAQLHARAQPGRAAARAHAARPGGGRRFPVPCARERLAVVVERLIGQLLRDFNVLSV